MNTEDYVIDNKYAASRLSMMYFAMFFTIYLILQLLRGDPFDGIWLANWLIPAVVCSLLSISGLSKFRVSIKDGEVHACEDVRWGFPSRKSIQLCDVINLRNTRFSNSLIIESSNMKLVVSSWVYDRKTIDEIKSRITMGKQLQLKSAK